MAQLAEKEKPLEAVTATVNYLADLGEMPYTETAAPARPTCASAARRSAPGRDA